MKNKITKFIIFSFFLLLIKASTVFAADFGFGLGLVPNVKEIAQGYAPLASAAGNSSWVKPLNGAYKWMEIESEAPTDRNGDNTPDHVYSWDTTDGILKKYQENGFRNFLSIISLGHGWGTDDLLVSATEWYADPSAPSKEQYWQDYLDFVKAVVDRYDGEEDNYTYYKKVWTYWDSDGDGDSEWAWKYIEKDIDYEDDDGLSAYTPITYWEVLTEAQHFGYWQGTTYEVDNDGNGIDDNIDLYIKLLRATSSQIRNANINAKVVLAGFYFNDIFDDYPDDATLEQRLNSSLAKKYNYDKVKSNFANQFKFIKQVLLETDYYDLAEFHPIHSYLGIYRASEWIRNWLAINGKPEKEIWLGGDVLSGPTFYPLSQQSYLAYPEKFYLLTDEGGNGDYDDNDDGTVDGLKKEVVDQLIAEEGNEYNGSSIWQWHWKEQSETTVKKILTALESNTKGVIVENVIDWLAFKLLPYDLGGGIYHGLAKDSTLLGYDFEKPRPVFYAYQHLIEKLKNSTISTISSKIQSPDANKISYTQISNDEIVFAYEISGSGNTSYLLWYEDLVAQDPWTAEGKKEIKLKINASKATVTPLTTSVDTNGNEISPPVQVYNADAEGWITLELGELPIFVEPQTTTDPNPKSAPTIAKISGTALQALSTVTILGRGFGETPGKVWFTDRNTNPITAEITYWKAEEYQDSEEIRDKIQSTVPQGAVSGPLYVVDQEGNKSDPYEITIYPPNQLYDLDAVVTEDYQVRISWYYPVSTGYSAIGFLIVKSTAEIEWEPENRILPDNQVFSERVEIVYYGSGTSFIDPDVELGKTYYYRGFAYDGGPNYATSEENATVEVYVDADAFSPFINSIFPGHAQAYSLITMEGTNFGNITGEVWFTSSPSSDTYSELMKVTEPDRLITFWSDNQIRLKVPAGAIDGNIWVINNESLLQSSPVWFTVDPPPQITNFREWAREENRVELGWKAPTADSYSGVLIVMSTIETPAWEPPEGQSYYLDSPHFPLYLGEKDYAVVYYSPKRESDNESGWIDLPAANNVHFRAYAHDKGGNYNTSLEEATLILIIEEPQEKRLDHLEIDLKGSNVMAVDTVRDIQAIAYDSQQNRLEGLDFYWSVKTFEDWLSGAFYPATVIKTGLDTATLTIGTKRGTFPEVIEVFATHEGKTVFAYQGLEIIAGDLDKVFLNPNPAILPVSSVLGLQPLAQDKYGNPVEGKTSFTWQLNNPSIGNLEVNDTGIWFTAGAVSGIYPEAITLTGLSTSAADGSTLVRTALATIEILPAGDYQLIFINEAQTLTAGETSEAMKIQLQNSYGNLKTSLEGESQIFLSTTATSSGHFSPDGINWTNPGEELTLDPRQEVENGLAVANYYFYYQDTQAGNPVITANKAGWVGGSQSVTIYPAQINRFVLTLPGETYTVGVSFNLEIKAIDQYGNILNDGPAAYNGQVNITDTTGTISPILSSNFANGILASQSVSINKSQDKVTITVSDTTNSLLQGTSNVFKVTLAEPKIEAIKNISLGSEGYGKAEGRVGELVKIEGYGFGEQDEKEDYVFFGGRSAEIKSWSDTLIEAYIPEQTDEFPQVSVRTNTTFSNAANFQVYVPQIDTIIGVTIINSIPAGYRGSEITIKAVAGKYFANSVQYSSNYPPDISSYYVKFAGDTVSDSAYYTNWEDGKIVIKVPENVPSGEVEVTVTAGGNKSDAKKFYVINPPSLNHIQIEPSTVTLEVNALQTFEAKGYDQYDNQLTIDPDWSSTIGSINENTDHSVTFIAPSQPAKGEIKAVIGTLEAIVYINVVDSNPPPQENQDQTPPLISIDPLPNNFSAQASLVFTGVAFEEESEILKAEYQIDEGLWKEAQILGAGKEVAYQTSLETFPDGIHTIFARATNTVNLMSETVKYTFVVDTTPPEVNIEGLLQEGSGSVLPAGSMINSSSVTLLGTAVDSSSTISSVEISEDDGNTWHPAYPEDGRFNSTSERFLYAVKGSLAGETNYTLFIKSTNSLNLSTLLTYTFQVDTTPPIIADIYFDGVKVLSGNIISSTPQIKFQVVDLGSSINLENIKIIFRSTAERQITSSSFDKVQVSSSAYEITYQVPKDTPLEPGTHQIIIEVKDKAGNLSTLEINNLQVYEQTTLLTIPFNYPNPFNPDKQSTKISFTLTKDARLFLYIYDVTLQPILRKEIEGKAGYNEVLWDGKTDFGDTVGSGLYLCRLLLEEGGTKKVIGKIKIAVLRK